MKISDAWARLARAVRWHRRLLAAVAAGCAVLIGLAALRPPAEPTVAVVVAAADQPAGHALAASDLRVAHYPADLAPARAADNVGTLTGRVLAAPVGEGTPVTERSTVSTTLSPGPGELLVPFHVSDADVLRLVSPGDRVTVVASGGEGQAITLATRARVVAVPEAGGGGDLTTSSADGALVVVSTDPATAQKLAAWSSGQALGLALG